MIKLDKIYTKGGDQGKTSLGDGSRRHKFDARINAYGTVDEANSAIGLARLYTEGKIDDMLKDIQNDLFDLGADLCCPEGQKNRLRIHENQITRLENEIDELNKDLAPLNSFILPGGNFQSSFLHLARSMIRKAERNTCELQQKEKLNPLIIKYLNRLSDLLFVLARHTNKGNDYLWKPGKTR